MRQIILDTETTGLDPLQGDRVIEVAAVEIVNLLPTGAVFHRLIDPGRDIPAEATRIHGFTNADLAGKPAFAAIAQDLLDFLGDAPIVAHNAPFDFGFLDAEFRRCGMPVLDRRRMVDSLALAKERYPGMPNSLDALCRRVGVDNSMRASHNAILDCRLLAEVYLELMGGKQPGFELAAALRDGRTFVADGDAIAWEPIPIAIPEGRAVAHDAFVRSKVKDALWLAPPFVPAAQDSTEGNA
ncbi:DNA polymerase III subunit epsilon [Roseomonas sp. HF4]|uniref:DNA polymerase III subunit epsilon n=1 Tax=Roseomonas sp. HF4 TaxID=2562313 RepID=UPI0010BF6F66|nr:DNA polymerase III subunit epsilon [Roseomonas sp. HF4]